MTIRAFELLLAVIETLVWQLASKGLLEPAEIRELAEVAKKEVRR